MSLDAATSASSNARRSSGERSGRGVNSTTCAITGRDPRHLSVFHHRLVYDRRLVAADRIVRDHLGDGCLRGWTDGWKVDGLTADGLTADDPTADDPTADDPTADDLTEDDLTEDDLTEDRLTEDEHPGDDRVEAGHRRGDGRQTASRDEGRRRACRADAAVRGGRVSTVARRVRDSHREPTAASLHGPGAAVDR
jgi:hypothetical protein